MGRFVGYHLINSLLVEPGSRIHARFTVLSLFIISYFYIPIPKRNETLLLHRWLKFAGDILVSLS